MTKKYSLNELTTNNDFVKIADNNMTGFKNEPNTNNWATQGSISKSLFQSNGCLY